MACKMLYDEFVAVVIVYCATPYNDYLHLIIVDIKYQRHDLAKSK